MVSAVECVSLMIHRPVPLGQTIHCMLIQIIKRKRRRNKRNVEGEWYHDGGSNGLGTQNQANTLLWNMKHYGVQE